MCVIKESKKLFIKASTNYRLKYGEKFGITKEEMEVMEIKSDSKKSLDFQ